MSWDVATIKIPEWTLIPGQLVTTHSTPEKRFIVAVIEQAIRDAEYPRGCQIRLDARAWIFGGPGKLTFAEACELVGLEPDRIRRRLSRGKVGLSRRGDRAA